MHDGMPYGRNQGQSQGHSREVDHQSPTGLIFSHLFCRASSEISCKNILKSTRGVHFTMLPTSPCATEFYEIWHTRSTHQHNHVCQIFSQSVQGLQSSDTPKIGLSH